MEAVGSCDNLRESGLDFAQLLADPNKDETGDESSLSRSRSGSSRFRVSSRRNSEAVGSQYSLEDATLEEEEQAHVEENRAEGAIGWSMYSKYFKAGGGFCMFYIMVMFCLTAQILASGGDYFVTYWLVFLF